MVCPLLACQVATVDEVLQLHEEFLQSCLQQCLLTNQQILKARLPPSIAGRAHSPRSDPACVSADSDEADERLRPVRKQHRTLHQLHQGSNPLINSVLLNSN